jgi:hypothetical protein
MSNISATVILFLCFAVGSESWATSVNEPRVGFTSYGPVRIGMSRHALEKALGTELKSDPPDADSESCEYVAPVKGHAGVGFMLLNQRLARIDVRSPNIKTLSGAHVGNSQKTVMAIYPGRVAVSPHFYTAPDGSYLTMLSPNRRNGIRFETDHGKVTAYYAGTAQAIQYVEGCQ